MTTTQLVTQAQDRRSDLVRFVQRLIQTPSMSGEEGKLAQVVQDEMRRLGYDDVYIDELGNIIGVIRGRGRGPSVMLNTHLDHVSPGNPALWTFDPFSGETRDDLIYGRGAVDIKGPLACQVYAGGLITAPDMRPDGDIYVVGAVHEERGGLGSQHLARTVRVDRAIVGEPSSNTLRRGHRGRIALDVTAHGRAAHASAPDRGVNPHYTLAAFLTGLRDVPMRSQDPFGFSTVAPTLYSTDNASPNVIPASARLLLDWRNVPDESPDDVLGLLRPLLDRSLRDGARGTVSVQQETLRTYTGRTVEFPSLFPSFVLAMDDLLVRLAQETLQDLLGHPFPPGIWSFATDGGHLMAADIPTVGFGPGDEKQAHVADEHIAIDEMVEALAAYAALARAFGAG